MSKDKITNWLADWKRNLLEVFVVAGILASGFTTFKGAYHLLNQNLLVALLYTAFFQGGLYVIGHYMSVSDDERKSRRSFNDDRKHRRTFTLCLVWLVLAFFSVYTSSLGMFDIQRSALRDDRARAGIFQQWNEAAKLVSDFKTRSLAELNQSKQAATVELNVERSRARAARSQRRPYPAENIQRLNSELSVLTSAENKVRAVPSLSITTPENSDEARRALDETFSNVNEAYAALPEQLRTRITVPRPDEQAEMSEHIQQAFFESLMAGSIPVILIIAFALLIDLLPPLVLFATSPKQTLPEQMLSFRLWIEEMRHAFRAQLKSEIELIQVSVKDMPELSIHISVSTRHGGPLLYIDRDFASITEEVRRDRGPNLFLESAMTASGELLEDGLPLLKQLGKEREVILYYTCGLNLCLQEVN